MLLLLLVCVCLCVRVCDFENAMNITPVDR